jgi:hypothetical protein
MITKLSQLEQDQMYLLCIHIEYVLVHDSIRWDLTRPQSISPTNWSCAMCKGAPAARAVLVERGRRELCRGRSWASREHTGHAAHKGGSATMHTRGEPAGEAAAGPRRTAQRWGQAARVVRHGRRHFARHAGDTAGWPRHERREPARRVWSGQADAPGRHAGVPAPEPHARAGVAPAPRPRRGQGRELVGGIEERGWLEGPTSTAATVPGSAGASWAKTRAGQFGRRNRRWAPLTGGPGGWGSVRPRVWRRGCCALVGRWVGCGSWDAGGVGVGRARWGTCEQHSWHARPQGGICHLGRVGPRDGGREAATAGPRERGPRKGKRGRVGWLEGLGSFLSFPFSSFSCSFLLFLFIFIHKKELQK